ncbi:hypothetical protein HEK616_35210 [Streptomyces nigrescens]|uniref:Uncharacterized protein n=1 Tax=Streptomyces nigrescens TaxID=1920 RepID=A0ABM7ZUK1_STRNI|nr:hypothetical protein HEK616_35210 [Streptomyces nigrescens]
MTLAAGWPEQVTAVSAVIGLVLTFVAVHAARAAIPRRKLVYSIEFTPLLSSTHSGLTVSLSGERINEPQTATLKLTNTGNREIRVTDFNDETIEFQLHARVVAVLSSSSTDNRREPLVRPLGNTLEMPAHVIGRRQEVTYKLLLDGDNPSLQLRHSLSASLKRGYPPSPTERQAWWTLGVSYLALALILSLGWSTIHGTGKPPSNMPKPTPSSS